MPLCISNWNSLKWKLPNVSETSLWWEEIKGLFKLPLSLVIWKRKNKYSLFNLLLQNYCIKACFLILLLMRTKTFKKQFSLHTHATLKINKVYISKTLIMCKLSTECRGRCKKNSLYSWKMNTLNGEW